MTPAHKDAQVGGLADTAATRIAGQKRRYGDALRNDKRVIALDNLDGRSVGIVRLSLHLSTGKEQDGSCGESDFEGSGDGAKGGA